MIRFVLDTNVFISGIFWSGIPARILDACEHENAIMVVSSEILEEYFRIVDIMTKKKPTVDVSRYIDLISLTAEFCTPVKLLHPVSRDPDDDKFIAAALSANCKLIVSGDKDLLDVSGYAQIKIIKPAIFVKQFDL